MFIFTRTIRFGGSHHNTSCCYIPELSLRKFVDYWTHPSRIENTNPNIAASVCGCSWFLALNYMTIGKVVEARALVLNGCFLQQCYVSLHFLFRRMH